MKVHNKPKAVLLHARMQRKQQQWKLEFLQISKEFCMVSVMIYVNDMQCMQLSIEQTVSNNGSYIQKIRYIFLIQC